MNKLIGIAGGSGSGKSKISKYLSSFINGDLTILYGDDSHKWERGNINWNKVTPLNPDANNLDIDYDHTKKLVNNKSIRRLKYSHESGNIIGPYVVNPNNYILFQGLHSFYNKNLRDLYDLKIYLEPDEELRKHWKIRRDVIKRGYTKEQVLDSLEKRKNDYLKYIKPQKEFADIIISFNPVEKITEYGRLEYNPDLYLQLEIKREIEIQPIINIFLNFESIKIKEIITINKEFRTIIFEGIILKQELEKEFNNFFDIYVSWEDNYWGIIQLIVFYCLKNT